MVTGADLEHVSVDLLPQAPALTFAYSPEQTGQWMATLQEYKRAILVNGADYMVIPGTDKPSLLKPGAEKLLMAAGIGSTVVQSSVDRNPDTGAREGVYYTATVFRGPNPQEGQTLATCDGYAGYDESRYYISQADNEAKERRLARQYNRPAKPEKMLEYRAPWNTVCKMAQKRALVGATLLAMSASGLFTQDLEDERHPAGPAGPAPFDAGPIIRPHLDTADPQVVAKLREWWKTNPQVPPMAKMGPADIGLVLVKLGELQAAANATPAETAAAQPVVVQVPEESGGVPAVLPAADAKTRILEAFLTVGLDADTARTAAAGLWDSYGWRGEPVPAATVEEIIAGIAVRYEYTAGPADTPEES